MKHMEVLTGRVGKIQELKEFQNGCVLGFSVAETLRVKNGEVWEDGATIWTNISVFGDVARNVLKSVKPGTMVTIIGERKANEFTPKNSTEKVTSQYILAQEVAVTIGRWNYIGNITPIRYNKDGSVAPQTQNASQAGSPPASTAFDADPFSAADPLSDFGDSNDPFGIS